MRLLHRRFPVLGGLRLFALLGLAMVEITTANAATLIVTTTADSGAGSLRAAIAAASNGDTIQFDPALNGQSITLTSGTLVIDKDITIDGPGANQLAVTKSSGAPDFNVFYVSLHTFVIEGLTIDGNSTLGTGVWIDRSLVALDGCVVQGCLGGGVRCFGAFTVDSNVTVINSTIRNNQHINAGGGIYLKADPLSQGMVLLLLTNSVVSNNTVPGSSGDASGGGIWNKDGDVLITNSIVSNNVSGGNGPDFPFGNGGGIYNAGFIDLASSTVSGNSTGLFGGGIYNSRFLLLTGSTVSGNTAMGFNELEGWGEGAAIYNSNTTTVTNSTLSNNNATHSGGAVSNRGSLTIRHSTLSGNNGFKGGTIANYENGATLQIGNTALKVSTFSPSISNISGTITSNGYNVINDNGGGFFTSTGDQTNTEPMLGPLQNNGGPTFTHELLTGSPAIDAGNPSFTPPPSNDQRGPGYARVFNGRLDIGSLEVQPAPTPTPTVTPTATPTATATATIAPTITPTPTPTPSPRPVPCDLIEGFENIATLVPSGWVRLNRSQPLGTTGWSQGNSSLGGFGFFPAQSGSFLSYIAANFLNGSEQATISNWLLTPAVTLQNGAKLSFWTRTGTSPVFPDRLQVRMSTNGTSQNVGATATDVGDFTTLLLDINPTYTTSGYPNGWTNFFVTLSGLGGPVTGRLAFRYFVENSGPSGANSDVIGIDAVAYGCNGTPPTPSATPSPTVVPTPTPGTPTSTVTGTILYCSSPLPNVRVNVTGAVTGSKLSDGSGNYTFSFLPWARDFTVTPAKAALAPGSTGITGVDAVAVQRHFLNLGTPLSGCRLAAADVTGNSVVDGVDAVAIQRFFLGFTTGIANTGKYQFSPASRSYTGNGSNWTAQNYDMVLFGDVF